MQITSVWNMQSVLSRTTHDDEFSICRRTVKTAIRDHRMIRGTPFSSLLVELKIGNDHRDRRSDLFSASFTEPPRNEF